MTHKSMTSSRSIASKAARNIARSEAVARGSWRARPTSPARRWPMHGMTMTWEVLGHWHHHSQAAAAVVQLQGQSREALLGASSKSLPAKVGPVAAYLLCESLEHGTLSRTICTQKQR